MITAICFSALVDMLKPCVLQGHYTRIVWARLWPTPTSFSFAPVRSQIMRRYSLAFGGSSSKDRASLVDFCQPSASTYTGTHFANCRTQVGGTSSFFPSSL